MLFTPTTKCPIQCRYCFRKNELHTSIDLFKAQFEQTLDYIGNHSEIDEIIFTGGDPFILNDSKISDYLNAFAQIPHVKTIRFHTRFGAILPHRFTPKLIKTLGSFNEQFEKIIIAFHLNHIDEMTNTFKEVCSKLREQNIELLSQTVLLKEVNNSSDTLKTLFETIDQFKIRPYYLHHPDLAKGAMHFYLSLEEGRRIYLELRKKLSGWNIPQYMIDVPQGYGKVWAFDPQFNPEKELIKGADNQNHWYPNLQ